MKRWKLGLVGLTLAASAATGCKQRLYITEKDAQHYSQLAMPFGAPSHLEEDPTAAIVPGQYDIPPPPTVDQPDRKVEEITLQWCIAKALEQGNSGSQSALFPGIANDNITASPRGGTFSDSIRVLSLDPAIAGADIEASLSKFDTRFVTSTIWNKQDQGIINRFSSNADTAEFATGFYKPLPTGGLAGITFQTDYQKLNLAPNQGAQFFTLSSSYRPRLMFQFEQPLLQNYGIEINQLLTSHPGTTQNVPGSQQALRLGGGRVEGILITRLRFEGAKADFEKNVNYMLLNVEYAYWNLYASYGTLYARDRALVDALVLYRVVENRFKAGGVAGALPQDVARSRAQLETFRAQRLAALGDVFEKERQLRSLLGMQYDGTRLVPKDKPVMAGYAPNWQEAVSEAMINRPELTLAKQDLKFRQFDLMVQRNALKPNLVFTSNYDINGVGRRLDGSEIEQVVGQDQFGQPISTPSPRNALASFANNKFNSWGMGLHLDIPLGFRDAHSAVRVARLNLIRSYGSMKDSERKVIDQLRVNYSRLAEYRQEILSNRAAGQAAAEQYRILSSRREIDPLATLLEAMLNAQQTRAAAETAEFTAIANYNNTLAGWQFAKGTILQYDNVMIADGPLPQAAQIRAADHIRERQAALEIREHPTEEHGPPGACPIDTDPVQGVLPAAYAPAQDVPGMIRNMAQPDAAARIPSTPAQNLPAFGGTPPPVGPTTQR